MKGIRNTFADCHPAVNFLWAVLVLAGSLWLRHPACLAVSLGCALVWYVRQSGRPGGSFVLRVLLPLLALTAALNPLFSHRGETILGYFPGGNPLTLESVLYGLSAGAVLVTCILWFAGLTRVLTADKFIVLFGRAAPSLSLLLSLTVGLVPRFRRRLARIREGQRALGRGTPEDGVLRRARRGLQEMSILMTWSLESSVQLADSMHSRGYGLPGRTSYDPRPMTGRDRDAVCVLAVLSALLLGLAGRGALRWQYYPSAGGAGISAESVTALLCYLAVCAFPMELDLWESLLWKTNERRKGAV